MGLEFLADGDFDTIEPVNEASAAGLFSVSKAPELHFFKFTVDVDRIVGRR